MNAMVLGLSHSFSRYKLKFSPDKVDTMIIQAIGTFNERIKEAGNSPGYRNKGAVWGAFTCTRTHCWPFFAVRFPNSCPSVRSGSL